MPARPPKPGPGHVWKRTMGSGRPSRQPSPVLPNVTIEPEIARAMRNIAKRKLEIQMKARASGP